MIVNYEIRLKQVGIQADIVLVSGYEHLAMNLDICTQILRQVGDMRSTITITPQEQVLTESDLEYVKELHNTIQPYKDEAPF